MMKRKWATYLFLELGTLKLRTCCMPRAVVLVKRDQTSLIVKK